jgi:hypothetical protein
VIPKRLQLIFSGYVATDARALAGMSLVQFSNCLLNVMLTAAANDRVVPACNKLLCECPAYAFGASGDYDCCHLVWIIRYF